MGGRWMGWPGLSASLGVTWVSHGTSRLLGNLYSWGGPGAKSCKTDGECLQIARYSVRTSQEARGVTFVSQAQTADSKEGINWIPVAS